MARKVLVDISFSSLAAELNARLPADDQDDLQEAVTAEIAIRPQLAADLAESFGLLDDEDDEWLVED